MVRFQDSILKRLHHHTLSNIFFDGIFDTHHARILSCFGPRVGAWPIVQVIFLGFWLAFSIFSITLQIWLRLPHLSIASILQCVCTHPIDLMGIYFLLCAHGNECTWTHDAVRDTFVTIVRDDGFHVGWEQLHAFPSNMFNSSCWQVDIVLTKNDICTLIDPTRMDLLFRFCTTQGFATYNVFQIKERSYCD